MPHLTIAMSEMDLKALKKKAEEVRVPHTILARMWIIQAMNESKVENESDISQ